MARSVGRYIRWDLDRLEEQVRSVCTFDDRGCWLWERNGSTSEWYPEIMISRRRQSVARWLLEVTTGMTGEVARHSCDRPRCCNPGHLSWGTYADNTADAVRRQRLAYGDRNTSRTQPEKLARGEEHGLSKLSVKEVLKIRGLHSDGVSAYQLAKDYGVTKRTITMIIRRKTWRHV